MSSRQACVEGLHALGCMVEERDLTIMLQAGAPRDELLALLLNRLVGGAERVQALYMDAANAPGHPTPSAASVMAELGFPLPEADDHEQVLRWLTDVLPVVLAAECPDAQGCSLHEQMRRDATFVDEIAFRQKNVFVRDVSLFPTEMRYAMDLAGVDEESMREQLAQIRQQLTVVQTELAKAPPPPEAEDETTTAEAFEALQRELAAFIHLAESFMATYVKDIRPWVNTCKTPVMQGIGPAATVALDAHTQLTEVVRAFDSTQRIMQQVAAMDHTPEEEARTRAVEASFVELTEAFQKLARCTSEDDE